MVLLFCYMTSCLTEVKWLLVTGGHAINDSYIRICVTCLGIWDLEVTPRLIEGKGLRTKQEHGIVHHQKVGAVVFTWYCE